MSEPKRKLTKMAEIEHSADFEKEQIDFKVDAALRAKGWKNTSSVPGSIWLWEKKLKDGRTLLVNKNSAVHVQSWIDEYGEEE